MTETCFLDTNILVYLFDTSEPAKRQKVKSLFADIQYKKQGCISTQVVNELFDLQGIMHPAKDENVLSFVNSILVVLSQTCRKS